MTTLQHFMRRILFPGPVAKGEVDKACWNTAAANGFLVQRRRGEDCPPFFHKEASKPNMTPSPFPRLHAYAQNSFPAHLSMGGGGDYQDTFLRPALKETTILNITFAQPSSSYLQILKCPCLFVFLFPTE